MSQRVIAFDPGEQTGWAIGVITGDSMVITAFGYDPWKKASMDYMRAMDGGQPFDVVVYESWRLRREKAKELSGSDMQSSQCIGIIKYGAWKHKRQLVTSEPAYKPVIDAMMGGTEYLPERDRVEHYRDAVRHLCWYAVTKAGVPPENITYLEDHPDDA
jgi:hypothetical protein